MDLRESYDKSKFSHACVLKRLLEYPFVDKVFFVGGRSGLEEEFKFRSHKLKRITPTSQELKKMMNETITRGTSRRAFRGIRRDRVLSKLIIGGKTGSIKNQSDDLLFDWFVGFGEEKKGSRKLAIAVLVVHDKLLRARAQEYARISLREYFKAPPGTS